jgi:two-component system response regulator YesN
MTKKLNILHVDDSKAIILHIKKLLSKTPAIQKIETSGTVAEAKALLKIRKIDVAILDISLPDGNGIELLAWIKEHYPAIIVIMFTNNSDSFFRRYAQKSGADYFLDKSMEFEDLLKILKKKIIQIPNHHETRV